MIIKRKAEIKITLDEDLANEMEEAMKKEKTTNKSDFVRKAIKRTIWFGQLKPMINDPVRYAENVKKMEAKLNEKEVFNLAREIPPDKRKGLKMAIEMIEDEEYQKFAKEHVL